MHVGELRNHRCEYSRNGRYIARYIYIYIYTCENENKQRTQQVPHLSYNVWLVLNIVNKN